MTTTPSTARPSITLDSGAKRRALLIVGSVALLALVAVLIPPVRHQAAASFTRSPAVYTEMYFANPDALPTALAPDKPASVEVVLVDHDASSSHRYQYAVTIAGPDITSETSNNFVDVAANKPTSLTVPLVPLQSATSYEVTVAIAGQPELLHFKTGGAQ